jgi:hypothetical protein
MAEVELAVGAVLDIASGKEVKGVESKVDRLLQRARRGDPRRIVGSATSTSTSVPTFIDAGGPPSGKAWVFRRITIHTAATLYAAQLTQPSVVYFCSSNPQPMDSVDYAQFVPAAWSYGRGELAIKFPDHLWVGVLAGSTGVQYIVTASVVEEVAEPLRVGGI